MNEDFKAKYEQYEKRAVELGAAKTKIIDIKETVVFADWVRFKCQFGCSEFGTHLTCPPYIPGVQDCKDMVYNYKYGMLLAFIDKINYSSQDKYKQYKNKIRKTLARLERQMMMDQYYKAFALNNGPCTLCPECVIKSEKPEDKKNPLCRLHKVARPSLESLGIDVFETAKKVDWDIRLVTSFFGQPTYIGLLLIE